MLGRAVVQNQVQNDAHAVPMRGIEQPVEICQRPIDRIDRGEVGDVIAEIDLGRWKERRQPEGVDLQRGGGAIIQIIETNGDTRQVADSVAIRIGKAAWVDLVEDRRSPPSGGTLSRHGDCPSHHEFCRAPPTVALCVRIPHDFSDRPLCQLAARLARSIG